MNRGEPHAGLRMAALPVEHLAAELLAFPLVGEAAYRGRAVALDPGMGSFTGVLWREAEKTLLFRFPGMTIDDLVFRRDALWFPGPSKEPVPLARILREGARRVMVVEAGVPRLRRDQKVNEVEGRRKWRWLTFSLPGDLLLAAAGSKSERMPLVSETLRHHLLDHGFAEPHLHLKAAMSFPQVWAALMRALAGTHGPDFLASPAADWDEGRDLGGLMLTCALARLLLAAYLCRAPSAPTPFAQYMTCLALPALRERYGGGRVALLEEALASLMQGERPGKESFKGLADLYSEMVGGGSSRHNDPMACYFPPSSDADPDFIFTKAAMAYGLETKDSPFSVLFWQGVRARVLFYRHIVQRPMVPGLQWFTRTYARLSKPRKPIKTREFLKKACQLAGPGLRSLEVRVVPEETLYAIRRVVEEIDTAAQSLRDSPEKGPEVGIVFHLSRSRGGGAEKGLPAAWGRGGHDDPGNTKANLWGYRFGGYYQEQRRGAQALANLLVTYPRMIERVRGVDLCTDELGVPLWVVRPLIRQILQAGDQAAADLSALGEPLPPPSLTVHSGEDFVHLISGLRRIEEAIDLFEMGEGMRLGHAVALGVDVEEWSGRARFLHIPAGERLLDLLWARRMALRSPASFSCWLEWLNQTLERLGQEIFAQEVSPSALEKWWQALHTSAGLRRVGFPDGPVPTDLAKDERPATMILSWLTDRALFERAQRLEKVDVQAEISLVQALQTHVLHKVGALGIAVEINPSSNLLIGHLGNLTSHPLWRLCPPGRQAADRPSVRVCIGSDDPITFATGLAEEYQLISDALTEAGVSRADTEAWIDAARRCGLESRFTVSRSQRPLTEPNTLTLPVQDALLLAP